MNWWRRRKLRGALAKLAGQDAWLEETPRGIYVRLDVIEARADTIATIARLRHLLGEVPCANVVKS